MVHQDEGPQEEIQGDIRGGPHLPCMHLLHDRLLYQFNVSLPCPFLTLLTKQGIRPHTSQSPSPGGSGGGGDGTGGSSNGMSRKKGGRVATPPGEGQKLWRLMHPHL